MQQDSPILNLIAALAFTTLSATASAQTAITFKSTCQDIGISAREPINDREGHSITVGQYSCKNSGGVEEGSIQTGMVIWEWDKTNAMMLSGNGIARKPGAFLVYQNSEAKASLTIVDGKVTGITGTAKGVYKAASGSMASLAGKSFSSTFRSIGAGQFVIETTVE